MDHHSSDIKSPLSLKQPQTEAHSESDQRTDKETAQLQPKSVKTPEQSPLVNKTPSPQEKQDTAMQKPPCNEQRKQSDQTDQNSGSSKPLHSPMEVDDEIDSMIGGSTFQQAPRTKSESPGKFKNSRQSNFVF